MKAGTDLCAHCDRKAIGIDPWGEPRCAAHGGLAENDDPRGLGPDDDLIEPTSEMGGEGR